jgi:hypothetical protein
MDFLMKKLDFDIGKAFEHEVHRKTGRLVHSHSSFEKGFYLLATFRRYLFQLNEELVALALQSCLGGLAKSFRVSYQSHNHFRFTVSCKAVGFAIYNLRRFIGASFDVYFHLWSNGAPHWGREKRLWEAEEAKQWSKVLSKNQKRLASKSSSSSKINGKRVRFAEKIVQGSPIVKSKPSGFHQSIKIGNLDVKLPCFDSPSSESPQTRGILKKSYEDVSSVQQQDDHATDEHEEIQRFSTRQCIQSSHVSKASCPPFSASFNSFIGEINRVRRLGGCVRCLELNHTGSNCSSPQGVLRVLRRVTNLSFVKPEAGQGFFEAQGAR